MTEALNSYQTQDRFLDLLTRISPEVGCCQGRSFTWKEQGKEQSVKFKALTAHAEKRGFKGEQIVTALKRVNHAGDTKLEEYRKSLCFTMRVFFEIGLFFIRLFGNFFQCVNHEKAIDRLSDSPKAAVSSEEQSRKDAYRRMVEGGESDVEIPPATVTSSVPLVAAAPGIFSSLEGMVKTCLPGTSPGEQNKRFLFNNAIALYRKFQGSLPEMTTMQLRDKTAFILTDRQQPSHFNATFNPYSSSKLITKPTYFDYQPSAGGVEDYWVDFANRSLGGGWINPLCFVQEEMMVAEMPGMANHIAEAMIQNKPIRIREGAVADDDRVLKGSPTPYLLKNVARVQYIDPRTTYDKVNRVDLSTMKSATHALDKPQVVNILAIAAPKLSSKGRDEQLNINTLIDVYNTLAAGFTIVKENSQGKPYAIHSGKLGCGAFNNNSDAVYLLHRLAAHQLQVPYLVLYDQRGDEPTRLDSIWKSLLPQFDGKTIYQCIQLIQSAV